MPQWRKREALSPDFPLCGQAAPAFWSPDQPYVPDQTSSDSEEDPSYVINITEEEVRSNITHSVVEKFKSLDDAKLQVNCHQKIRKVPSILRDNNNFTKHYEPRMIAIGPYHHKNPNLKITEKIKLKLASLFIEKHTLNREVLYSKVKREIKDLRECYEEEPTAPFPDDDNLAWMFFVDGCALLHYIYFVVTDNKGTMIKEFEDLGIKIDYLVYVQQDLFLLENQLPYRVLKLLLSCMSDQTQMKIPIENFIISTIKAPNKKHEQLKHKLLKKKNEIHLLHLLRTGLLLDRKENQMSCEYITEPLEKVKNLMEFIVKPIENCFSCTQVNDLQFFRNVEELKAAGIRLRPSNTGCLKDITFNLGTLRLPPILVDDSTASKFLNLIAYEICPDFVKENDLGVSSYVAFLDILIDQAQDVKELRDKQILYNFLGSDEEVAKLFNEIGTNLVSDPNIYRDVKSKIQRRYDNKFMTSIAQFIHEYFQSPWSMIAFLAATTVLASTILQTVYTLLGYYK